MPVVSGITNYYSQSTLGGDALETDLEKFVQVTGGTTVDPTAPFGTTSIIYGGNIDSANLATNVSFPNSAKLEPYGVASWHAYLHGDESAKQAYIFVEQPALLTHVTFSYGGYSAGTPTVGGDLGWAVTSNAGTYRTLPVPPGLYAVKDDPSRSVATWYLPNFPVHAGDIIFINYLSVLVSVGNLYDLQFTFWGKSLHR